MEMLPTVELFSGLYRLEFFFDTNLNENGKTLYAKNQTQLQILLYRHPFLFPLLLSQLSLADLSP